MKQEGKEGVIDLKALTADNENDVDADDPEAVKLMVDFFYANNYVAPAVDIAKAHSNSTTTPSAIDLAPDRRKSRGNRAPPRKIAKRRASMASMDGSSSSTAQTSKGDCNPVMHATMYGLGSKYGIKSLKNLAMEKYKSAVLAAWNSSEFAHAIRVVYTTTPDNDLGLRNITTETILEHKDVVLAREDVEAAVIGIDKLAYALLMGTPSSSLTSGSSGSGEPTCDICHNAWTETCNDDECPAFVTCSCGLTLSFCPYCGEEY